VEARGDTVDASQKPAREFRVGDRVRILDPGTYADGSRGRAATCVGEIVTVIYLPDPDGDLRVEGDGWTGFVSAALVEPVAEADPEPAREFRVGDWVVVSRDAKTVDGGDVYFNRGTTGRITDGPDADGDLEVTARDNYGELIDQWVAPKWLTPAPVEEPESGDPWPTEPGLYWVRGVATGDPVEGLAFLDDKAPRRMRTFARDRGIWEDEEDDRLDEAVPLTAVPTELLDRLYGADDWDVLSDARHDMEQWTSDHEDGAR
jgi:ribosomal protein L21E